MKKVFYLFFLISVKSYAQSNTDCFSIEPGQVIEVPENSQVGDTIATIQYCSSGEWKKIEAEYFSTLALKENGQLYTWGINGEGGNWPPITAGADPTQYIIFDPYLVKDPTDNTQDFILDDIASSIYLAFGIKSEDKSLWGWGRDQDGQLGIGENPNAVYPDFVDYRTPQLLNNSTTWKTVSAGSFHGNAIDTEGKLWGWGYADNSYDQNGFNTIKYTPTQVGTDSDWDVVSCGYQNTYLIKENGTLWVMGLNSLGSSGLGENPTEEGIVQIGTDSDWSIVNSYGRGAIAIKDNGELYVWGHNDNGKLGFNSSDTPYISNPTQIPGTENINFIYADVGRRHGLASDIDGNFYGWGENLSGQLGNGEIETFEEFQLIDTGDILVRQVSAAGRTSGFISEGGSMRMFGSNDTGQLGYGEDAVTNPNTPVEVNLGEELENATIIKYNSSAIAQGVLTDEGHLWVWGDNEFGRLGLGHADRIEENYYPNRVGETSDVWTDFSHSGSNLYGVKNNKLYAAGQNDNYNIGLGLLNTETQLSMIEVPGVDMTQINSWQSSWAGFISIKNNGELWGFGGNWKGQLAIGPNEQIQNTMNTIDVNEDGLGGINNIDNISEENTLRIQGDYETGQFTTNGLGIDAVFSIKINENGEASISIVDGGSSFTEDDIITISNTELGDNRNRSLIINGDFEAGSNSWIIGVDDNTSAPTITTDNNTYYSENVLEAGEAYSVNVSQKTEIINGNSYTLTFDAWSDRNRAIIAGIGLSSAPFDAITETIDITTERTTYSVTMEATFGDSDARVLFDLGAEVGLVNIDDVSLINNNVAPDLSFQVDVYGDNEGTSSIPRYQKLNDDTDWYKIYDTKGTDILIVEKNDGSIWFAGGNSMNNETEIYNIVGINGYNNNGLIEIFPSGNDWNTFSSSQGTVIGIKDDGTMWSFGANIAGIAGVGSDENWIDEITQIGSDSDWRHINLNGPTALAIKTDNSLWAWGSGWTGQLGNGTFGNANQPVLVSGDIQWETTGGGWLFQTAVANNGTIYGWGYNRLGGLGGLGEVSSEYLDWTTDVSIIDGAFTFSDLGYVIIQDSEAIDYETISNSQGRNEGNMTNSPIEITIPMTMSDGVNTSEAEDVIFKIINVNETPTDIGLSEIEFNEDNSIGQEISEISVTDPDLNDSHVLQIDTEFGDFEKFEITNNQLKLIESVSYHEYETLSIKIIAEDEGELSFSKEFTINVLDINDAPIGLNDELTILEDASVTSTNVILNDTDEDNDDLMITDVSSDGNGTVAINTDTISIDYTPEANFNGTETITYTLSDGDLTATATLTISVTAQNDAPVAEDDQLTVLEDASVTTTNVILNDSDIDGDDLMITDVSSDGNGTVAINADAISIDYTPEANFNGTETITYTLSDGDLTATATLTISVTAQNDAPVAEDDQLTVLEDASVTTTNVILNDSDIDGDDLMITDVSSDGNGTVAINADAISIDYTPEANFNGTETITYTLSDGDLTATATLTISVTAQNDAPVAEDDQLTVLEDASVTTTNVILNDSDIDGDDLMITDVSSDGNGTVAINADAISIDYTPEANFNGTETITYTLSDGDLTATATLTTSVTAQNDAPIAEDDQLTVLEDASVTSTNVILNDSDIDGDDLMITDVSSDGNGTVAINADAISIDYTPEANFNGTETITYTLSDGDLTATATLTISVTAQNDAPIAEDDQLTVLEDASVTSTNVILNDSDIDGDDLMITDVSSDGNGTVAINTDTISIDYTPEANFNGTETITYTLSDGDLTATATLTISVTAQNDAPVAEDGTITLVQGNTENVILNATDIDNSELSFNIEDQPVNGSVTVDGNVATFVANESYTGSDSFTFTATDGDLVSNIATITVDVTLNTVNFSLQNIKTYPNPIDNYYIVETFTPLELKIYDINGRILNTHSLKEGENRIDTSLLSNGIYLFNYTYKTYTISQIIVKK